MTKIDTLRSDRTVNFITEGYVVRTRSRGRPNDKCLQHIINYIEREIKKD